MKLERLKPGMIVYDVQRVRMGNTKLRSTCVYGVRVISVDAERKVVTASWNGNIAREFWAATWSKWRLKKPKLVDTGFCGQKRLARKGE